MSEVHAFPARRIPADTLALRLVTMRHELGISQRKASELTGVKFGTWQGMEMGRQTRGLDTHVQAIADGLGYDKNWIMWGRSDTDAPPPYPDGSMVNKRYPLTLATAS